MKGRRLRKNNQRRKKGKKEVAWKPGEKRGSRRVQSRVSETAGQVGSQHVVTEDLAREH